MFLKNVFWRIKRVFLFARELIAEGGICVHSLSMSFDGFCGHVASEKPSLSRVDQDVDKRTHRSFLGVASAS